MLLSMLLPVPQNYRRRPVGCPKVAVLHVQLSVEFSGT